jgi:hypothetical protein
MTIARAGIGVTWATLSARPFIGIVAASIALTMGTSPGATGTLEDPSAYALIPAQLSMDRKTPPNAPAPKKRKSARPGPDAGLTSEERKRLAEAINRMTPAERKKLAKAMKRLTPEERSQLAEVVKQQLSRKGTGSQLTKNAR